MLKPLILSRTNTQSIYYYCNLSYVYFLELTHSQVKDIYTHDLISACRDFHSTRCVRGAEVVLWVQNIEHKL